MARECHLLKEWQKLCPLLQSRVDLDYAELQELSRNSKTGIILKTKSDLIRNYPGTSS